MPPIIAGVYHALNKNAIWGSLAVAIFLSLQILVNHLQITYYTLLIILIYIIFHLIYVIQEDKFKEIIKPAISLFIAVVLAVGSNFASLYLTYDYGKDSMRGKSELKADIEKKTSGLDKDYATAWSYGVDETITLLIPNFKGGASGGELSQKSAIYELFEKNQGKAIAKRVIKSLPLYWGNQTFTAGPVYVGAVIIFFFVLGLFVIKGRLKWWIVAATLLSIMLAWGRNFMFLTDIFLDYFPGYNKFRTVSMTLIIAEFTIPLLALLAVQKILFSEIDRKILLNKTKVAFYIVGGLTLFFAIFPGMFFDFSSEMDQYRIGQQVIIDALIEDRKDLLQTDAFRSFVFIAFSGLLLLAYIYKKVNRNTAVILLGLIVLIDMWPVNKRYLNNDDFISKRKVETPYEPTQADKFIMKDTDIHFRVLNLTRDIDKDGATSYFHKSIGGYHGAKMKRYQELIDYHISKQNMDVLNMLNAKYFIVPSKDRVPEPQINFEALGNAWFVSDIKLVENADEEIDALNYFDPAKEAIVDIRFEQYLNDKDDILDSTATINLETYSPDYLKYKSNSKSNQLAVFSEIYYNKGWNAYIDQEVVPHFRVNYVLRALNVPAGEHVVEFKFQPKAYYTGNMISGISSGILILLIIGFIVLEFLKPKEQNTD